MEDESTFKELHKRLRCKGCYYANEKNIGKAPCCTYYRQIRLDQKTGRCLSRKKEES